MLAPQPLPVRPPLRRARGPFVRWPRAADAVLALVLLVLSVLVTEGRGDSLVLRPVGDVPPSALLVPAVAAAALAFRRRAPLRVLAVVLAAWGVTLGSDSSDLGGLALVALYSAGRYAPDGAWTRAGLAGAIAVVTLDGVIEPVPWGEIAFGVVVFAVTWYAGRRLRLRGERAEALRREEQAEAQRIVVEERTRIARELHDVVAHRVSLMTVQAGAARMVADTDPVAARRAMQAVEEAGRQALDELRHLLGVLRPESSQDQTAPQARLADLPALVEQTRSTGLDVTLASDGLPAAVPMRVELSAYRIVQESLTNVVKHAGPGARTTVRLTAERTCLVVDVSDDGRGASVLPGGGHGIVGMRERALLLGGTLEVGPRPEGGFRVLAHLPLTGAAP